MNEEKQKVYHGVVARYHFHDARWFAVIGFAPYVIAFAGMITSSVNYFGWSFDIGSFLGLGSFVLTEGMLMFPVYFLISMLFFAGIEWYVLCRHCPCYEHSGKERGNENRFYCLANWGSPKFFKYKPGHISRGGQAVFVAFVAFFLFFPILYYVENWEFIFFQLLFAVIFYVSIRHWTCSSCPNFGCILNCVPEDKREAFLRAMESGEVYG